MIREDEVAGACGSHCLWNHESSTKDYQSVSSLRLPGPSHIRSLRDSLQLEAADELILSAVIPVESRGRAKGRPRDLFWK